MAKGVGPYLCEPLNDLARQTRHAVEREIDRNPAPLVLAGPFDFFSDEALGDRPIDRRADRGVVQLLARQFERGTPILEARLQTMDVLDRRLI